jgi:hypothetical protein
VPGLALAARPPANPTTPLPPCEQASSPARSRATASRPASPSPAAGCCRTTYPSARRSTSGAPCSSCSRPPRSSTSPPARTGERPRAPARSRRRRALRGPRGARCALPEACAPPQCRPRRLRPAPAVLGRRASSARPCARIFRRAPWHGRGPPPPLLESMPPLRALLSLLLLPPAKRHPLAGAAPTCHCPAGGPRMQPRGRRRRCSTNPPNDHVNCAPVDRQFAAPRARPPAGGRVAGQGQSNKGGRHACVGTVRGARRLSGGNTKLQLRHTIPHIPKSPPYTARDRDLRKARGDAPRWRRRGSCARTRERGRDTGTLRSGAGVRRRARRRPAADAPPTLRAPPLRCACRPTRRAATRQGRRAPRPPHLLPQVQHRRPRVQGPAGDGRQEQGAAGARGSGGAAAQARHGPVWAALALALARWTSEPPYRAPGLPPGPGHRVPMPPGRPR